ncbi:putative ribosomal protein L19 [Helianthus annuus]|nr:putative ribosomal protein L19 [Helianthus annuus]
MQTRPFWGAHVLTRLTTRGIATLDESQKSESQDASTIATEVAPRIKFKRLDKTATHIMQAGRYTYLSFCNVFLFVCCVKTVIYLQILDREAVEEVRTQREIPDIRPGYIIQLRLEVPENKRHVSTVKLFCIN